MEDEVLKVTRHHPPGTPYTHRSRPRGCAGSEIGEAEEEIVETLGG